MACGFSSELRFAWLRLLHGFLEGEFWFATEGGGNLDASDAWVVFAGEVGEVKFLATHV